MEAGHAVRARIGGAWMRLDRIFLNGIGTHRPEAFPAAKAVELGLYDEADFVENGLTGVCIAGEMSAPEMAVVAARQCLARSGLLATDIDVLLYATVFAQGPEVWSPAAYVQREVVNTDAPAIGIGQGCNGMLAALELAACYLTASQERTTALLAAADNCTSPQLDRWRSSPGFLPADAASALLVGTRPGFARLASVGSVTIPELEPLHRGDEPLFPAGGATGRMIDLRRRGEYFRTHGMLLAEVAETVAKVQGELIERLLAEAEITLVDLSRVVYVNAARYLTEHWFTKPLGVPLSKSAFDFGRNVGHAGASDQTLSLEHLVATGQVGPGDHVLLAGLAPGMSIAAAVIEILERPAWATN
jgi:3-oxoacyl-[acyl-carrier-protein] synthase III